MKSGSESRGEKIFPAASGVLSGHTAALQSDAEREDEGGGEKNPEEERRDVRAPPPRHLHRLRHPKNIPASPLTRSHAHRG